MRYPALLMFGLATLGLLWLVRQKPVPLPDPVPQPVEIPLPSETLVGRQPVLIEHQVINRQNVGGEISFNVFVGLVEDRLPTKDELQALAQHLTSRDVKHDTSSVSFYLTSTSSEPFAVVSQDPALRFELMPENLPERYRALAEPETGTDDTLSVESPDDRQ